MHIATNGVPGTNTQHSFWLSHGNEADELHDVLLTTGVVPLLDTFWDNSERQLSGLVLVMPLLAPLVPYRASRMQLTFKDILRCTRQLLLCLMKLHEERQVVHMDIKPSNILSRFSPTNGPEEFFLSDFGLAHMKGSLVDTAIGTSGFKAPEVARMERGRYEPIKADPSQDIYSLGRTVMDLVATNRYWLGCWPKPSTC